MRKFLVSIMFVLVCTSANADIVYLTDTGAVGRVSIPNSYSADLRGTQYAVSWNDPFLGSYWDGSHSRVILVDRDTDTTASGDTALVFDPSDLTRPIDSTRKVLAGVYSAQAMTGSDNGRSIFFASGSSIHEFSTGNFSLTRSYTYKPKTSEDITSEIVDMITGSNVIYALVQQDISHDIVFGFDGQLRDDVSSFERRQLANETEAISWLSGSRVAAGHEYGVDIWRNGRGFLRVLSTDAPVKAVCQDSGSGFYFIEQSESGDIYTTTLRHYKSSAETSTLFTNTDGRMCRLARDSDNGIVAVIAGDEILLYIMDDDTLLGEYDSSQLGSLPVQIVVSALNKEKSNDNSGCNMAGIGMMLFLAAACVMSIKFLPTNA